MGELSGSSKTSTSTRDQGIYTYIEMEGGHSSDRTEQAESREVDSNDYSDAQLLHLLYHKKASARDPHTVPDAVIQEVNRDVDLHPNAILNSLGKKVVELFSLCRMNDDCFHGLYPNCYIASVQFYHNFYAPYLFPIDYAAL